MFQTAEIIDAYTSASIDVNLVVGRKRFNNFSEFLKKRYQIVGAPRGECEGTGSRIMFD